METDDNQLVLRVDSGSGQPDGVWLEVSKLLSRRSLPARMGILLTRSSPTPTAENPEGRFPTFRIRSAEETVFSGRALAEYGRWIRGDSYQQTRFIALKLLNRRDFSGTFRFLDREPMFTKFALGVFDLLIEVRPNLIVFDVTPHEFYEFVVWSVADSLGIPVLFFQPCPITPAMLARTNLGKVVIPEGGSVADSVDANLYADLARTILEKLADGADPQYMMRQKNRDRAVSRVRHKWLAVEASFRWLWRKRFPESIHFSGHQMRNGVFVRALEMFLVRSLQLTLRRAVLGLGQSPLPLGDYCVFALHYEPERTSLPDGLPIDFQADAIIAARALMPEALNLVVKEHYSQQTSALRGFLGRSPDFYGLVDSFPRTHFASTTDRLSDLIVGSKAVFTLTGTVALEAVLRGVPVIYFGHPWWEGLPGTFRIDGLRSFREIERGPMPSKGDVVSFIMDLISNRMVPGLPEGSAQIFSPDVLGPVWTTSAALSITRLIEQLLRTE